MIFSIVIDQVQLMLCYCYKMWAIVLIYFGEAIMIAFVMGLLLIAIVIDLEILVMVVSMVKVEVNFGILEEDSRM